MLFLHPSRYAKFMTYIYTPDGQKRSMSDSADATYLIETKRKNPTNVWPVVEACLEVWGKKNPTKYKSFLFELEGIKNTRRDKFASSETEMFRYTLDIPETVVFMLRKLYSTDELPFDKKFFRTWARKFPLMQIAEKI